MTPFDQSGALWLRAYPRRWRVVRSAEVTDVFASWAAPGARQLPARAVLGLVRDGWATRWREHPPFWRWLGYCLVQLRLPTASDDWVRDERTGLLTGLRTSALPFAGFVLLAAGVEGGLRHLGWVTWTFTTNPVTWWVWLAIALVQAVARTLDREEWLAAYFPTATDAPGHFGPYTLLDPAGPSESSGRVMRQGSDA
jgi:hypothetical protein